MGDEGEDRLPSLPEAESPEPGARGRGGLEGGREGLETRASMATGPTARAPVRDGDSSAAEVETGILAKALEVGKWAAGYVIEH